MTHNDVQLWLDRYVAAWSSYDPVAIGELFAEDAEYRYHPWDEPVRGREEIVRSWVAPEGDESQRDEPGSWDAHYDAWAVEGDRATAIGESRYRNPDGSFRTLYYNNWALRFDANGRCVEFVEYYMELPERLRPAT
jgi:ketosteroid isomerase-like protein